MNIEKELHKFLYNWVAKNFGESEAEDPSWSIEALAHDLAIEFMELDEQSKIINITDDILEVAEDNGIDLKKRDAESIARKYRFSEGYCRRDDEDIKDFIEVNEGRITC